MLIEDDLTFSKLVHFHLISFNEDLSSEHIQQVDSIKHFEETLSFFYPEIILLDLNLPDSNGLDTFLKVKNKCPHSAIIILSGSDEEELSAQIAKHGAQDYLIKSEVSGRYLKKAIDYCLERLKHQHQLEQSEKKFRESFENSPVPMFTAIGNELIIQLTNKAFNDLYEGSIVDFFGKKLKDYNCRKEDDFFINEDKITDVKNLCQITISGKVIRVELITNKLGSERDLYICSIIDKTEQLRFQEEKMKIINEAQENEKQKIAREIHDGLAQNLVVMNLLFGSFEFEPNQQGRIDDFSNLIKTTIEEAKSISYQLLPPQLEKGFLNGLKNVILRINSLKTQKALLEISDDVKEDDFNSVDKFNLFRIIQEFFNNSIKHSQSEVFNINITKGELNEVIIIINDNGVGFDMEKVIGTLGISNMLSRIDSANIRGNLNSEVGAGTSLELIIQ
jgi:two-component system, NarL family, sensor histidine kinase UhpB